MANPVVESGERKNITATTVIKGDANRPDGAGLLMGVFVSQASATPTIKLADANGTIANTFTPIAGSYYPLPCRFVGDLTVTISGTVDATVFYTPSC